MTLQDLASGAAPILMSLIGGNRELARQLQRRLGEIGLLDPPVDGSFGPVSHWALQQVLRRLDMGTKQTLDAEAARALLDDHVLTLFPLNAGTGLAGRIVAALQAKHYWLCHHPDAFTIIYVEGLDPGGDANDNAPNAFNDLRVLLRVTRGGTPTIEEAWDATTEPGAYYTKVQKLDPRGAARVAFGQYKAWTVGTHLAGRPSAHEALVQVASIDVHRDMNEDFDRLGDRVFSGVFGVNQHWGYDLPKGDIGRASAGCLVGRTRAGHRQFMTACKSDPRYRANQGYRFMTAVLPAADVC